MHTTTSAAKSLFSQRTLALMKNFKIKLTSHGTEITLRLSVPSNRYILRASNCSLFWIQSEQCFLGNFRRVILMKYQC